MSVQKILITGSNGTIGKLFSDELKKQGHELALLDLHSSNPVDLLNDPVDTFFSGVDTVIHLAAHVSPFIEKKLAEENIEMCKKVIEACGTNASVKRIINASSINAYPYFEIYKEKGTITRNTPLSPNLHFPPGEYARAKIECERLFEEFCKTKDISLVNLRFGHVTKDDVIPLLEADWETDIENKIFLSHADVRKIARSSVTMNGSHSYLCVSNPSWLFGEDILFPLREK